MARTPSNMPPLGMIAPDFSLPDTDGKLVRLADTKGAKGYLIFFICNHCPYVVHIRAPLAKVTAEYAAQGIAVFGINSNDAQAYPDDSPQNMKLEKAAQGYRFPYLFDATQTVAEAYQAACTPDFYLFDEGKRLTYRGQFDDSRPGNGVPATGADLTRAVQALLDGHPPVPEQKPSLGCNIKWKQ